MCVLDTLGPWPIDTVAPIISIGALPLLILLQAVKMAAQVLSELLEPGVITWYVNEANILRKALGMLCTVFSNIAYYVSILPNITQYSCIISFIYLAQCVASCCITWKGRVHLPCLCWGACSYHIEQNSFLWLCLICKWSEYFVESIVHVILSIFKYCLFCLHAN